MSTTAVRALAQRVVHDPQPTAGGYSGETFSGLWFRERAYVRLYVHDPARAAVDLAIMRRLAGKVPMPKVLAAEPRPVGGLPPHLVTVAVPGQRADVLLERGLPVAAATALGRQCARVVAVLRAERMEASGPLVSGTLDVGEWPEHLHDVLTWARHLEPGLASAALGPRSAPGLREALVAASSRLTHRATVPPSLVHGDLNGKNLVIDPNTGRLRAVLDWEHAHAGDWAEDVGNLLRGVEQGLRAAHTPVPGGSGADAVTASWKGFRHGLVDSVHESLLESGTAVSADGIDDDWLGHSADLDLFALLELAARPERTEEASPPVVRARESLRALASSRTPR